MVIKEQYVSPCSENYFRKIFETVGILDGTVTIQVQAGPQVENGVGEMEMRISPITLNYEWRDCVNTIELYAGLSKRQKQMLLMLSEYTTEKVVALTGYSEGYIKQLRFAIYERINTEGNKKNRSRKGLKLFCKALMAAGVSLIVWTPEMVME